MTTECSILLVVIMEEMFSMNNDHVGGSKSISSDEDSRSDCPSVSNLYELPIINDMEKLLEFHKFESFSHAQLSLREYVFCHGIHSEEMSPPSDALRSKFWKVLLGVPSYFEVDSYLPRSEVPINIFQTATAIKQFLIQ